MEPRSDQTFGAAATLGWAGVAVYGIWEMAGQDVGDGWERPYLLFTVSLVVALAGTAAGSALGLALLTRQHRTTRPQTPTAADHGASAAVRTFPSIVGPAARLG